MSGITDSAKFNSTSSYYIAKDPSGGGSPPQTITGNLVVTGTITSDGALNSNGGLNVTGPTVTEELSATSVVSPFQTGMGTISAPVAIVTGGAVSAVTFPMVGNKLSFIVTNTNPILGVPINTTLTITNPLLLNNQVVPIIYRLNGVGQYELFPLNPSINYNGNGNITFPIVPTGSGTGFTFVIALV